MNEHINGASVCRFADIEVLRYKIDGFEDLSLKQKLLVYHLSEATLAGRDIIFDQNGSYNLALRHLFEGVFLHYRGDREVKDFQEMRTYLYRLWFSSGIHHHYASDKFVPLFSKDWLRSAVLDIQNEGYLLQFDPKMLEDLLEEVFDPKRSPKRTEQSGEDDLLYASCANFYDSTISQEEAEAFYQGLQEKASEEEKKAPLSYGLNTRLCKDSDGKLYEEPYMQGGLYSPCLEAVSTQLKSALAYTESEAQREAILALLDFYKTGSLEAYNRYCILWLKDTDPQVDFINGFTETYTDPLGLTGSWEGLVHIKNKQASERTEKICREASWFEAHAPIPEEYKKDEAKGISASVVTLAMLGGDSYPATPIGINLPNADWIRAEYGSKSVSIENIHEAYRLASEKNGLDETFIKDPEIRELLQKYGGVTEALHTDLHECLGHGSGKLASGVSSEALGAYGSTIEEARADLFALYYMADEKLLELGVLPSKEAYKACYYRYLFNGLVMQYVRIPFGKNIEEAHMRNRALIARYVLERAEECGAVRLEGLDLYIHNYDKVRQFLGEMLYEVQRIKSEGDFAQAKAWVEQYGVKIDPVLHKEVLSRYEQLNIAPYKGFVNPRLELVFEDGGIVDVRADYTEDYEEQMLRYSQTYGYLSEEPSRLALNRLAPLSKQFEEDVRELRASLRRAMDGIVSTSMRKKGLHYGVNFGLTIEHIQSRANRLTKSAELSRYLLSRDVRELKIIAMMIYPVEEMHFDDAYFFASKCFSNVELRDYLAMFLFDRLESAPQWAIHFLLDERSVYEDLYPLAYIILARHSLKGYQVPSQKLEDKLMNKSFEILNLREDKLISPLQTATLLFLKRWIRQEHIAEKVKARDELVEWKLSADPILQEFAHDLFFELEFQS